MTAKLKARLVQVKQDILENPEGFDMLDWDHCIAARLVMSFKSGEYLPSHSLFHYPRWPVELKLQYQRAKTHAERARVAAAAIDHYVGIVRENYLRRKAA